jgi:hypothetical protein
MPIKPRGPTFTLLISLTVIIVLVKLLLGQPIVPKELLDLVVAMVKAKLGLP